VIRRAGRPAKESPQKFLQSSRILVLCIIRDVDQHDRSAARGFGERSRKPTCQLTNGKGTTNALDRARHAPRFEGLRTSDDWRSCETFQHGIEVWDGMQSPSLGNYILDTQSEKVHD
jgi:hypothetical protein